MLLLDRKPNYDTNTINITKSEFHTNTVLSFHLEKDESEVHTAGIYPTFSNRIKKQKILWYHKRVPA